MKQFFSTVILFLCMQSIMADTNRVADLGLGTVNLLDGYTQKRLQGIDSIPGTLNRADGKFTINYHIGPHVGYEMNSGRKSACSWYREQLINGRKASIGIVKEKNVQRLIVTITDGRIANFSAPINNQNDVADMLLIVTSYKPKQFFPAAKINFGPTFQS